MNDIHYYELRFFHDEDDSMATQGRCSFCIKTEISPVISNDVALSILFGDNPSEYDKVLMANLTCIIEVTAEEAKWLFDTDGLTIRIEKEYGVFYTR